MVKIWDLSLAEVGWHYAKNESSIIEYCILFILCICCFSSTVVFLEPYSHSYQGSTPAMMPRRGLNIFLIKDLNLRNYEPKLTFCLHKLIMWDVFYSDWKLIHPIRNSKREQRACEMGNYPQINRGNFLQSRSSQAW
jgi:hypothetical protein